MKRTALFLACLAMAGPTWAGNYYVDGSAGIDQAGCGLGTGAAACKTVTKLHTEQAGVGGSDCDTVHISGQVWDRGIVPRSGSSSCPTIYDGDGPASTLVSPLNAQAQTGNTTPFLTGATQDPTFTNLWRYQNVTAVVGAVFDTDGPHGKLDGRTVAQGGKCVSDGSFGCNGAVLDFPEALSFTPQSSLTLANNMQCSFFWSGTDLYVHTCRSTAPTNVGIVSDGLCSHNTSIHCISNSDCGAPNTCNNPAHKAGAAFDIQNGTQYVTIRDMELAYTIGGGSVLGLITGANNTHHIDILNNDIHSSANSGIFWFQGTSTDINISNNRITTFLRRNNATNVGGGIFAYDEGYSGATQGGIPLKIQGASGSTPTCSLPNPPTTPNGAGANGWLIDNNHIELGWDLFSWDNMCYSTFTRNISKVSENHNVVIAGRNNGQGNEAGGCHDLIFSFNTMFQDQEEMFNRGCTNSRFYRNLGFIGCYDELDTSGGDSHGCIMDSNISNAFQTTMDGTLFPGASTNGTFVRYNWFPAGGNGCSWNTTKNIVCTSANWCGTGCPSNTQSGALLFAGVSTYPFTAPSGIVTAPLLESDFYPLAGSDTINNGNPDIDGDGTLETGAGGDDECTIAHHCFGGLPDIGPFEYGIDTPSAGGDTIPPSPMTVTVTGQTSTSCSFSGTLTYDDANTPGSGNIQTFNIRSSALAITTTNFDSATPVTPTGLGALTGGSAQTWSVSGLTASTTYHFAVVLQDSDGNPALTDAGLSAGTGYVSADVFCTTAATTAACNNGTDDDGDTFVDTADLGCTSSGDTSEGTIQDSEGSSTWTIPCTVGAYIQSVQDANSLGGGKAISYACATPTSVTVNTTTYTDAQRRITSNGNNFDFTNMRLIPDVANQWRNSTNRCGSGVDCDPDDNGVADVILNVDDQNPRLMVIEGDSNTVRNLYFEHFADGIRVNSTNSADGTEAVGTQLLNITCFGNGDACVGGDPGTFQAKNTLVQNLIARQGIDKAIHLYGRDSGWGDVNDWDFHLNGVTCEDEAGCVRANQNGYFKIDNLAASEPNAVPLPDVYLCDYGIRADSTAGSGGTTGPLITIDGLTTTSCNNAITAAGDAKIILNGGIFNTTDQVSVRVDGVTDVSGTPVAGIAKVSVTNTEFKAGPGGTGVSLASDYTGAAVDLGGGSITFPVTWLGASGVVSSTGGNKFIGSIVGVANNRAGYTVQAKSNCWNDSDPSNEVTCSGGGSACVIFSPQGAGCSALDTIIPSAINNLVAVVASTSSCTLTWDDTGDEGMTGTFNTGSINDLRYRKMADGCIDNETEFGLATPFLKIDPPTTAGGDRSELVTGLLSNTQYCFAIKTRDEVPTNWSPLNTGTAPLPVTCTTANVPPPITNPNTVTGATIEGGGVQ